MDIAYSQQKLDKCLYDTIIAKACGSSFGGARKPKEYPRQENNTGLSEDCIQGSCGTDYLESAEELSQYAAAVERRSNMNKRIRQINIAVGLVLFIGIWLLAPVVASAHCDTTDGPVITAAKAALEKGDVTPVLRWVKEGDEAAVRAAFKKTLTVRAKGPEAKELADMYFFETLVRIHRAGEGAPYSGIEPAGTDLGPAVAGADKALEIGSVDSLVKLVTGDVAEGIRERFTRALERKKHADESVEAGRKFVEAYVEYVHYVERLHEDAVGAPSAHHGEAGKEGHSAHHHK